MAGPAPSVDMVSEGKAWASPAFVHFLDPSSFVAGNIHRHLPAWERTLELLGYPDQPQDIVSWLREGVRVESFFTHFKGRFQGKSFDSDQPTETSFPNASSCKDFDKFITDTILQRVQNGSLMVWGEVGVSKPPKLVMPITIEPGKPRMCHDERFLNNWIRDCPFSLDYLTDLPRYVLQNHFQTTMDDKSGYDHISLHPSSRAYFGLEWKGWYFVYTTLPFGWKASAYIYQSVGMLATSLMRFCGVPCSQYIDDRHVGQLRLHKSSHSLFSGLQQAEMAAFIACSVLTDLGYFIGLSKSCLAPKTALRFLGYIVDSEKQAFILPEDKRRKFASLREDILGKNSVSLKNLQKFAGKTTSFSLVVPAAKLFTNACYRAISIATKASNSQIKIKQALREEITHWRFLDTWTGFLPWLDERHVSVVIHSDASDSGWGGTLERQGHPRREARGYWEDEYRQLPIAVREAWALLFTIERLLSDVTNTRVDGFVDSKAVLHSWERQTSKCPHISDVMKEVFSLCASRSIALSLHFVPSRLNLADGLSRTISDLDACVSPQTWFVIDSAFGPHSIDLMAIPDNVRCSASGRPLRFFSPTPCPGSAGTNAFTQAIAPHENVYVFPPFILVGPLLKFLLSQGVTFSMVVPDLRPKRYWWPIIRSASSATLRLGRKGDSGVLLFPPASRHTGWATRPLQWDLWVFRVSG